MMVSLLFHPENSLIFRQVNHELKSIKPNMPLIS